MEQYFIFLEIFLYYQKSSDLFDSTAFSTNINNFVIIPMVGVLNVEEELIVLEFSEE